MLHDQDENEFYYTVDTIFTLVKYGTTQIQANILDEDSGEKDYGTISFEINYDSMAEQYIVRNLTYTPGEYSFDTTKTYVFEASFRYPVNAVIVDHEIDGKWIPTSYIAQQMVDWPLYEAGTGVTLNGNVFEIDQN